MKQNLKINTFLLCILTPSLVVGAGSTLVGCHQKNNNFQADPWNVVAYQASFGLEHLKEYYGLNTFVGLEKTMKINDLDHTVRVIGEGEDDIVDQNNMLTGKKAALTLQFSTIISQKGDDGNIEAITMPLEESEKHVSR